MGGDKLRPVTVRFTGAAYDAICDIAHEQGMSMADVVRKGFDMELSKYLDSIIYMDYEQGKAIQKQLAVLSNQMQQILFELRRIGVNYNQEIRLQQIARKYNQQYEEINQKYAKKIKKPAWKESFDDTRSRVNAQKEYETILEDMEATRQEEEAAVKQQSIELDVKVLDQLINRYEAATQKVSETLCHMLGSAARATVRKQ